MARLFEPLQLGHLTLVNKIVIAPMCQYSANNAGEISFWHEQQWANYALSGAALTLIEATAVQPEGRISDADVGLWNDVQRDQIKAVLTKIKVFSPQPFGVQLAHAGRKASTEKPWLGKGQIEQEQQRGWQTVAPSEVTFLANDEAPHALSLNEIQQIQQDFAQAARRAVEAGFALIEVHAAHGYLLHQFMSPLSNQRTDEYGGSFSHRIRMTLETFQAMKQAVPQDYPLGVRLSAQDWVEGGWTVAETVELSKQLEQLGAAYIHISSGGLHAKQDIRLQAGYQVPFAEAVKKALKIPVIAVGLITEAKQAEQILQTEQADAIALARAILYQPRWPWQAAAELGAEIQIAPQYLRCQPHQVTRLFQAF